jgi:hypothetical protein
MSAFTLGPAAGVSWYSTVAEQPIIAKQANGPT